MKRESVWGGKWKRQVVPLYWLSWLRLIYCMRYTLNEPRKLQKLKYLEDTIAQQFLLLSIGPACCLISMQIHMIDNAAFSSAFVRISICDRSNEHFFSTWYKEIHSLCNSFRYILVRAGEMLLTKQWLIRHLPSQTVYWESKCIFFTIILNSLNFLQARVSFRGCRIDSVSW